MLDYSYNTVVKNDFWLSWNENNFYFLDLLWRNIFQIYLLTESNFWFAFFLKSLHYFK